MSKLREKLKDRAEIELSAIVHDASSALDGLHPDVQGADIATLIYSNRTATLRKKVISRMVARLEDELVAKFDNQQDLPLADKKETL